MLLSFIVGAEETSYAKQDGNFGGDFPKRELAGWAQPRPAIVLATTSTARYLAKDFTAAASSSFTSKTV